jgi:hypothetical protein
VSGVTLTAPPLPAAPNPILFLEFVQRQEGETAKN